ncbi:Holliday junction branch migration protein RuvA [Nitriliruptoraceae bacterium ZYF776]|nr:Holliday junction branch migration protein RuvA [Profundirhabdus halotolerans]
MISHLRGTVAHRDPGAVVLDVHGVGYLVHVTPGERIPARGQDVELHTSLQVREESMTLYGFADRASLVLFELLLTASGVGPKLALAYLSTHRPDVLRTAIAGGDVATLTTVPGVGKKGADRLVLELKDKVGGPLGGELPELAGTAGAGGGGQLGEVRDALLSLGYSAAEVQDALGALDGAVDDTAGLLRRALRHLGATARA